MQQLTNDALIALARDVQLLLMDLQNVRKVPGPHARGHAETQARMQRVLPMAERARQLRADLAPTQPETAEVLGEIALRLESVTQAANSGRSIKPATLHAGKQYEALARLLREQATEQGVDLAPLKPRNYTRNAYHVFSGFMSAALYTIFSSRTLMLKIAGIYTGCLLLMEIARRIHPAVNTFMVHKMFGAIARPHEAYKVNAGTWYGIAICVMVWFFNPLACICGVLALGVGDPAAAIIGKRFGKHKLRGHKSLEGMLGFFGIATVVITFYVLFARWLSTFANVTHHPQIDGASWLKVLGISAVAAAVGAVTEVYCEPVEDNFAIPLTVAGAVSLCA